MCKVCDEWKEKMARAQRLMRVAADNLTVERLEAAIRDYEQKLHAFDCPDKRKPRGLDT